MRRPQDCRDSGSESVAVGRTRAGSRTGNIVGTGAVRQRTVELAVGVHVLERADHLDTRVVGDLELGVVTAGGGRRLLRQRVDVVEAAAQDVAVVAVQSQVLTALGNGDGGDGDGGRGGGTTGGRREGVGSHDGLPDVGVTVEKDCSGTGIIRNGARSAGMMARAGQRAATVVLERYIAAHRNHNRTGNNGRVAEIEGSGIAAAHPTDPLIAHRTGRRRRSIRRSLDRGGAIRAREIHIIVSVAPGVTGGRRGPFTAGDEADGCSDRKKAGKCVRHGCTPGGRGKMR